MYCVREEYFLKKIKNLFIMNERALITHKFSNLQLVFPFLNITEYLMQKG